MELFDTFNCPYMYHAGYCSNMRFDSFRNVPPMYPAPQETGKLVNTHRCGQHRELIFDTNVRFSVVYRSSIVLSREMFDQSLDGFQ